jgi:hypothetical protein
MGSLTAVTDTTNRVATAFITLSRTVFDPTSQVCTTDPLLGTYCHYGRVTFQFLSANVNAADLTVGANTARLRTNLSSATGVVFSSCLYDEATVTTTCTNPPSVGTIDLQWQKTSTDSRRRRESTTRRPVPTWSGWRGPGRSTAPIRPARSSTPSSSTRPGRWERPPASPSTS